MTKKKSQRSESGKFVSGEAGFKEIKDEASEVSPLACGKDLNFHSGRGDLRDV